MKPFRRTRALDALNRGDWNTNDSLHFRLFYDRELLREQEVSK